jgi:hypothetical protein
MTATQTTLKGETMTTATEQRGATVTDETYVVFYSEHKDGSPAGMMIREGIENAERAETLMYDSGYERTSIRHAWSMGEM